MTLEQTMSEDDYRQFQEFMRWKNAQAAGPRPDDPAQLVSVWYELDAKVKNLEKDAAGMRDKRDMLARQLRDRFNITVGSELHNDGPRSNRSTPPPAVIELPGPAYEAEAEFPLDVAPEPEPKVTGPVDHEFVSRLTQTPYAVEGGRPDTSAAKVRIDAGLRNAGNDQAFADTLVKTLTGAYGAGMANAEQVARKNYVAPF